MERDGFVTRRKDATDGRVQRVWLTDKARALQAPATTAAAAQNDVVLAQLSEAERVAFLDLMDKAIAAMKETP